MPRLSRQSYPHTPGEHYGLGVATSNRCPRGHVLARRAKARDYRCPDCHECFGPCRCFLFEHVTGLSGTQGHRVVAAIMGGGFRVTYHPERLAR